MNSALSSNSWYVVPYVQVPYVHEYGMLLIERKERKIQSNPQKL